MRLTVAGTLGALALGGTACAQTDIAASSGPTPSVAGPAITVAMTAEAADTDFDSFVETFRADALAAGVSAETYDREMATVQPVPRVMELNANQPEFSQPVWKYLDSAVSDRRVADGITSVGEIQILMAEIEAAYGVDLEIMGAIWGLESSYGRIMGDYDILSALATLGHEGRRTRFGREQLIGALKILDNGYANREQLRGSWAGAMGQTQFIPTTYLSYAVDHDGDTRRDLWSNHGDVFASTANYLAQSGYQVDAPWGFEVVVPDNFDYATASLSTRRTVAQWIEAGVTTPAGTVADAADLNAEASIILPMGARGPAFMVFDNFRAIMRYNNSTAYALGIGRLSDAIGGRLAPLSTDWPRDDRPLSRTERKQLQQRLKDLGYDPGPVDGIIGAGTQAALRQWQKDNGLPADGYASAKTLEALTSA